MSVKMQDESMRPIALDEHGSRIIYLHRTDLDTVGQSNRGRSNSAKIGRTGMLTILCSYRRRTKNMAASPSLRSMRHAATKVDQQLTDIHHRET